MPHVITQWETMSWRRDDPEWKRVSKMSTDLKENYSPSTPRRAVGDLRSCDTSPSQYSSPTPSSVFSSTFDSRPSPSSSISSTSSFKPVFELEDTSSPIQQKACQSLAGEQDSLKITVYAPEIAALDLPSPARFSRGRLQSVALTAKVGEQFAVLEEDVCNLIQQLSAKEKELAAKDKDLKTAICVAKERQRRIDALTEQIEHCHRYHTGPPTPPKPSSIGLPRHPAPRSRPRPTTAGPSFSSNTYTAYSASETNLPAGFRISNPIPGSFQTATPTPGLPRTQPSLISLSEAAKQQAQRRRDLELRQLKQRSLRSGPSLPTTSGGSGVSFGPALYGPVPVPDMAESKMGGFLGKFGRKKD